MRTFNHLTAEERYHIYIENKKGKTTSDIAKDIRKHKSTISRELARNTGQRGLNENHNGFAQIIFSEKSAVESGHSG